MAQRKQKSKLVFSGNGWLTTLLCLSDRKEERSLTFHSATGEVLTIEIAKRGGNYVGVRVTWPAVKRG